MISFRFFFTITIVFVFFLIFYAYLSAERIVPELTGSEWNLTLRKPTAHDGQTRWPGVRIVVAHERRLRVLRRFKRRVSHSSLTPEQRDVRPNEFTSVRHVFFNSKTAPKGFFDCFDGNVRSPDYKQ